MTTPTPDELDQATIDLIFCLRDSLTDDGPSRMDFWNGRATTAVESAAAGASDAAQAVTIACRKLQISVLTAEASRRARRAARTIDQDFSAWQRHIDRTLVYVVALAKIQNQDKKTRKTTDTEKAPF